MESLPPVGNVLHKVNRLVAAIIRAIYFERIGALRRLYLFALTSSPRDIDRGPIMEQNPSFPSPEELKAKLSEFMKSNFGDKVSFATFTQPEPAERGVEEKPPRNTEEQFVF